MESDRTWTAPLNNGLHHGPNGCTPAAARPKEADTELLADADSLDEPECYRQQAARLRRTFLTCVSDDDMRMIVRSLVWEARHGNVWAAREIFNRVAGKAADAEMTAE